jgi:hypothetical protein
MNNISEVIRQVIREWNVDPYEINNGSCESFAIEVIERMGGYSDDLTDNASPTEDFPGHYWVEYKGRAYDAECPEGVDDWQNLPIFCHFRERFLTPATKTTQG